MEYSDETMVQFIKESICLGDSILYKYFEQNKVKSFRKRLAVLKPENYFENNVYVVITNMVRDIILKTISRLSQVLAPFGDMIITGGEAFNYYIDKPNRIVTSDIDTKFVPIFIDAQGNKISEKNPKYFGYLQYCKLFLWNELGKTAVRLNSGLVQRLNESLPRSKLARFLGIRVGSGTVRRRYTLIRKRKQSETPEVTLKDVLIDVELFSLDIGLEYYSPEEGRRMEHNLGGLLDIVIARPGEVGYDVVNTKKTGIFYTNLDSGEVKFDPHIKIASKLFLVEDLYLIQSLGLRPHKKVKDRKRMYVFCKNVLGIKNISSRTPSEILFKLALTTLKNTRRNNIYKNRPRISKHFLKTILKINPERYRKYTTPIADSKLKSHFLIGLNIPAPKFQKTFSNQVFNIKTKRWTTSKNPVYIRNQCAYRPTNATNMKVQPRRLMNLLYSYSPSRNTWMPRKLVRNAAEIPFIGLKTSDRYILKNAIQPAKEDSRRTVLCQG
jgi:hypothetical protein